MKKILVSLQKLGKALMLPIAALPIAGLLLRFGQGDLLNIPLLATAGGALFDNLPLLFAIGIAVGLAKDNNGAAGLAGAVSYFILNAAGQAINYALQLGTIFSLTPDEVDKITGGAGLTNINMAHFGGIVAGVIAGVCYNKYKDTKLPEVLGFFGGRRFVPIVTGLYALVIGGLLGTIWPTIQAGLDAAANWMVVSGGVGAFLYGLLNRCLLPFGLHHVVNSVVWFNFGTFTNPVTGKIVSGDLWRFFEGDPLGGIFTAGFFPIMMFALPAAAFAMYVCAKPENKKTVGGALFSVALVAMLTGVTEPIEFMFMFLAPVLFVVHGVLTGASLVVCQLLGVRDSFIFSAGLTDYLLNWGIADKGWMIIPIGLVFAVIYFFLFVFFIKAFDLKTPGREDDEETETLKELTKDKDMSELAQAYVDVIGGKDNVEEIQACITRIRLVLKDNSNIQEKDVKALGASGLMKAGKQVTQVIVGTKAEILVDEMKKYLDI